MIAVVPQIHLVRGDVVWVDLRGAVGHEKQQARPCLVIQNDIGNTVSPLTIIMPITDAAQYKGFPMQVLLSAADLQVADAKDSVIEGGHIRSIDRDERIDATRGVWCHLSDEVMHKVDDALRASLSL